MKYAEKVIETLDFLQTLSRNQKLTICRDRINFLIYLKISQAKTQAQSGRLIGLKEHQSQNLWQIYRTFGLSGLLDVSRKTYFGKVSSQQLSRLRDFLKTDQADSLEAIEGWLLSQEQVNYTLGGIRLLCKRLKIKLKTGRPSNLRKDVEGLETFKKTFKTLPKIMANQSIFNRTADADEMRFGTRTELKRRWTPQGYCPLAPLKIGYQFSYLCVALCPFTGKVFSMILPSMSTECFKIFIEQFNDDLTDKTLMIADKATIHQAKVTEKTQVVLQHLPTACPELNPVERFFKELRKKLSNKIFHSIENAENKVIEAFEKITKSSDDICQLTLFPYITNTKLGIWVGVGIRVTTKKVVF